MRGAPHKRTAEPHTVGLVPRPQQLGNIDTQLKQNMTEYNNVRQSVNNIERKQTCVHTYRTPSLGDARR